MRLISRRALIFAAGLGALLPGALPAAAVPRTYTVVIDKMKFGPLPAGLRKGDAIIWVNRDILKHTATAADHSFDADLPAEHAHVAEHLGAVARAVAHAVRTLDRLDVPGEGNEVAPVAVRLKEIDGAFHLASGQRFVERVEKIRHFSVRGFVEHDVLLVPMAELRSFLVPAN